MQRRSGVHGYILTRFVELVLFYYTFVSLKARSVRVLNMNPREFSLRREIRHFQALVTFPCATRRTSHPITLSFSNTFYRQIIDDGFNHSLAVYEDPYTRRHRLHASVWDDNLKHCPVWTAFCRWDNGQPFEHIDSGSQCQAILRKRDGYVKFRRIAFGSGGSNHTSCVRGTDPGSNAREPIKNLRSTSYIQKVGSTF